MKNLPIKPRVDVAILAFLKPFRPGEKFTSQQLIKHVNRYVTDYVRPDTTTKYLRLLRKAGKINYDCPCRQAMEYIVI